MPGLLYLKLTVDLLSGPKAEPTLEFTDRLTSSMALKQLKGAALMFRVYGRESALQIQKYRARAIHDFDKMRRLVSGKEE